MTDLVEIGNVVETLTEAKIEWVIPNFLKLPEKVDSCFTSPDFSLSDTTWYLAIYPNGLRRHQSEGWIGLYLHREDAVGPRTVQYTLGVKRADDVEETIFTESLRIEIRGSGWGVPTFLARSTLNQRKEHLLPSNALTVTCHLKNEERLTLQGGRFLSRAIQTELSGNLTDEENKTEEENCTSFDTEGVSLLSECMKELLINGSDHDVKISVKDKEFWAHRNILRARSPVFAMMLTHDTKENNTSSISIEDCDPDIFDEFLLYVYSGKTENLTPRKVLNLYFAADKYDFPVLKERCVNFLKTSLSASTICDVILLAAKHEEDELFETATSFFAQNIEEIIVTVEWQRFLCKNPIEANELYIKSLKTLLHRN